MNEPNVGELRQLLGQDALLLSWPTGTKGTKKPWGHLTIKAMSNPAYLAKLATGNIGVALGQKSGGLCSIDIDLDEAVEPFLELNPKLKESLRTKGRRGCNVWVKIEGDYPRSKTIKTLGADSWGEWRASGNQTIIAGKHPEGMDYKILVHCPPVAISFDQIIWPADLIMPTFQPQLEYVLKNPSDYTDETEEIEATDDIDAIEEIESCKRTGSLQTLDDVLTRCVPIKEHDTNQKLFLLARGIKTLEQNRGSKFNRIELIAAFNEWWNRAKLATGPTLREMEEYKIEFFEGYTKAKYPIGGDALPKAWRAANEEPHPTEAAHFDKPELKVLIALCYHLQKHNAPDPFYVSSYDLQKLFNLGSNKTADNWLKALEGMGIIKTVIPGYRGRSTRYLYIPDSNLP